MKNKMSSAGYWLVAFVLILALACGGGGGGGGSASGGGNGGSTGGNTSLGTQAGVPGFYLELQDGSGGPVDSLNLRPGTSVRVQGVSYDQFGNRSVLSTANVTLAGSSSGVVVDANRNLSSAGNTGFFDVSATVTVAGSPRTVSQQARFTNSGIAITGNVSTFLGGTVPKYLQIDFFDPAGNKVGAAQVAGNGSFRGHVSTATANRFTFNERSIDDINADNPGSNQFRFYKVLRYQSSNYTAGDLICAATLPALGASGAALPATVYIPEVSSGPPPPPTGCN